MKPLPSSENISASGSAAGRIPSIPTAIPVASGPYSTSNRKSASCPVQRVYPLLLLASTAVAAVFCLLYITKPVILTPPTAGLPPIIQESKEILSSTLPKGPELMPKGDSLPGEPAEINQPTQRPLASNPNSAPPASGSESGFEESNLRVQHVLTAETPGGDHSRIVLDVPVLYQSRNLRWTEEEVATARDLLNRLTDHQEKTKNLRSEGIALLDSWNHLIENSIPSGDLRADSPSLPANQGDASQSPRPAMLNSTESIEIRTAEP